MDRNSVLIPSRMKAQLNEIIRHLQENNEYLSTLIQAIDSFIQDDSINSRGFNNLKIKMGDYKVAVEAAMKANSSNIIDSQKLINLVGDVPLIGAVILERIEREEERRSFFKRKVEQFQRLRDAPVFESNSLILSPMASIIQARAESLFWVYSGLLNSVNETLHNLNLQVEKYNEIEAASKYFYSDADQLLSEVRRGAYSIRQASGGFPYTFESGALTAWRKSVVNQKDNVRNRIASLDRDKLIQLFGIVDHHGNFVSYNWNALRGLDVNTIKNIIKAIEGKDTLNHILQMVSNQKAILDRDGIAWTGYELELLLEQLHDYQLMQHILSILNDGHFSPAKWVSLRSAHEREELLKEFHAKIYRFFGINTPPLLLIKDMARGREGSFFGGLNEDRNIELHFPLLGVIDEIDSDHEARREVADQAFRLFGSIIHELRHLSQLKAMEHPEVFMVSPPTLRAWEQNWGVEGSGVKFPTVECWGAYLNQILELDARRIQAVFEDWALREYGLEWPLDVPLQVPLD